MRNASLRHVLQTNGLTAVVLLVLVSLSQLMVAKSTVAQSPSTDSSSADIADAPRVASAVSVSPVGVVNTPDGLTETNASVAAEKLVRVDAIDSAVLGPATESITSPIQTVIVDDSLESCEDRIWLFDTRCLATEACRANLSSFQLKVSRVSKSGCTTRCSYQEYLASMNPNRASVLYVHGNRRSAPQAIKRGLFAYNNVRRCPQDNRPIDWVIWSWPSDRDGFLLHDARRKAARTDTQSLYLASVLRDHVQVAQPTCMIGFSFGGRIVSGSLHALAGGAIAGRTLPGDHIRGAQVDVGMIAPALQSDWMSSRGAHCLATKNCDRLILLYNRKDAILKNFWLLNRIRNVDALGYSGPVRFADRFDGTRLPVFARDCSPAVGRQHREADYYTSNCRAGNSLALLIPGCFETSQVNGR